MPYPSRALRASLPLLLVLVAGGALIARREVQSTPVPPAVAPDPARTQRLAWFREAKYGLFIHWGLYAIPAGEWKGRRSLGLGEWIMNRSQDPGAGVRAARAAVQPGEVRRRRVGAARPGRGHEATS